MTIELALHVSASLEPRGSVGDPCDPTTCPADIPITLRKVCPINSTETYNIEHVGSSVQDLYGLAISA